MTDRGERGAWAEEVVARYLTDTGFLVLERNARVGRLEIDLVALHVGDRTLCVVEVRYRGPGAWQSGLGSIDLGKRLRLRRAGERLWQRRYRRDTRVDRLRFDVAVVTDSPGAPSTVEYIPAAF